jgi:hypothetical protein
MPGTTLGERTFWSQTSHDLVTTGCNHLCALNPAVSNAEDHALPADRQKQGNRDDDAGHHTAPLVVEIVSPELVLLRAC